MAPVPPTYCRSKPLALEESGGEGPGSTGEVGVGERTPLWEVGVGKSTSLEVGDGERTPLWEETC